MDYDFSGLCADQIDKLDKRLVSLKKEFMKEYVTALYIINDVPTNENMEQIKIEIDDLFNNSANRSSIMYTECMNKVKRALTNYMQ